MFTIYSIGDSAFLAQILNALAMICGTSRRSSASALSSACWSWAFSA